MPARLRPNQLTTSRQQPCRRLRPLAGLLSFQLDELLTRVSLRRGGEGTRRGDAARGGRVDGRSRRGSGQWFAGDGTARHRATGHGGRVPAGRAVDGHSRGEGTTLHIASLNVAPCNISPLHHGGALHHGPLGIRRTSPSGTPRAAAAGGAGDHLAVHRGPTHRRGLPAPFADVAFASRSGKAPRARIAPTARAVGNRT